MNGFVSILNIFRIPTQREVAARQLAVAKLELMGHQKDREYSEAMVTYRNAQITRLERVLKLESDRDEKVSAP